METKIENLTMELHNLQAEKYSLEGKHAKLVEEREAEKHLLQKTIDDAAREKEEIDKKWQQDFEQLRTINIMKEQQLLDDFEWKLREVEQKCKKRVQDTDKKTDERLQDAYKDASEKIKDAENIMDEVCLYTGYSNRSTGLVLKLKTLKQKNIGNIMPVKLQNLVTHTIVTFHKKEKNSLFP